MRYRSQSPKWPGHYTVPTYTTTAYAGLGTSRLAALRLHSHMVRKPAFVIREAGERGSCCVGQTRQG